MLPPHLRIRRSEEFRAVLREGRKVGRRRLVVHQREGTREEPARVGFIVSKAVGNSVVRHRVSRQLRHLVADRIGTLPQGDTLVVRALPAAAGSSSRQLGDDLDSALRKLARRAGQESGSESHTPQERASA